MPQRHSALGRYFLTCVLWVAIDVVFVCFFLVLVVLVHVQYEVFLIIVAFRNMTTRTFQVSKSYDSMDWFKGKFTGNPHI